MTNVFITFNAFFIFFLRSKTFLFPTLFYIYGCVLCVLCCVDVVNLYNAALKRHSFQSSTWNNDHGNYSADLANDGSLETRYDHEGVPRCMSTEPEPTPWWAVDLGRPFLVFKVLFTNSMFSGMMEYRHVSELFLSRYYNCITRMMSVMAPKPVIMTVS